MTNSLKDLILGAEDIDYRDVQIPEWNDVTVRVKALTDYQLGEYQAKTLAMRALAAKGDGNSDGVDIQYKDRKAEVVAMCLYDPETDKRIFADKDAPALGKKSAGVVNGLYALITKLSGLDRNFDERVDAAEGN